MKEYPVIVFCLCIFLLHQSVSLADDADSHFQRGDRFFQDGQLFSAVDEYEQAALKDPENPDIFRKLSLLYYDLGLLDESVSRMEKAVLLSPHSETVRMDMGIAYLAKGRLEDAKKQFMAAIEKNPGFANASYYLGEIFYREKEYGTAWMFAKWARCLGHRGNGLSIKLKKVLSEPQGDPCVHTGEGLYIRQILVDTGSRAETVIRRIAEGELFEDVAEQEDRNSHLNAGGYLGKLSLSEIDPRLARALAGHTAFSAPVTVETELGFHVIQKIAPFQIDEWKKLLTDSSRKSTPSLAVRAEAGKTDDTGLYLVYAGSNRREENAIEDVRKLIGLGYPAYRYEKTTGSKGTLHIVVAGKYDSFEKAKETADNIARHGFSVFIRKAD